QAQVGSTWGDYVRMLDDNAASLGRLGQHVVDVGDLWAFEVQQAIGFSPVSSLAGATDLVVAAPGLDITFGRVFSPSVVGRYDVGPLGRGWSWTGGWQDLLQVESDGTVLISGHDGGQRRFQPDSRHAATYFARAGDHATLTALAGDAFQLREPDGLV